VARELETRRNSRRAHRKVLRRIIPAVVAIILIIIVLLVCFAADIWKKFTYSHEKADLDGYFKLEREDEAAIIFGDAMIEEKALVKDGRYYVTQAFAEKNICSDYYYDVYERQLLHTGANDTRVSDEASGDFIQDGDSVYLALDYLQSLVNLQVDIYPGPAHIRIKNSWGTIEAAKVKKHTNVRILGGIKSDILTEISQGDEVQILDRMDDWSCVLTPDGYIGYMENKLLGDVHEKEEEPVTDVEEEEIVHTLRDHKICLGWHQVMSQEANSSLESVAKKAKGMNVISPTWFSMADNTGGIKSIGSQDYVKSAHANGLEVWALIDNFNLDVSTTEVLTHTDTRRILENNIIQEALALGVDGVNIDFEQVESQAGPAFAQFIRELSIPCRQNGLVLSVDNYVPREHTSHYDRKTQGKYADYVVIMGYDEHYAGSDESGSVASFEFVQSGIDRTLLDVAPEQVINGVPFYTRIWKMGETLTSEAVGMQAAEDFLKTHGMKKEWDDLCAQNYSEKEEGGVFYQVWLEDAKSISAKLSLMESKGIAGVACWKLGFETQDIWDVISGYMK